MSKKNKKGNQGKKGQATPAVETTATTEDICLALFRHGYKDGGPDLDAEGQELANYYKTWVPEQLAGWFPGFDVSPANTVMFAAKPDPGSDRPLETGEPLSEALDLEIYDDIPSGNTTGIAAWIMGNKGKLEIGFWKHGVIPQVLEDLQLPADSYASVNPWPGSDFTTVVVAKYTAATQTWSVQLVTAPFKPTASQPASA